MRNKWTNFQKNSCSHFLKHACTKSCLHTGRQTDRLKPIYPPKLCSFESCIWLWFTGRHRVKVDQHSVLNGLSHEDSAIKWKIYILGVKKWRKSIRWRIRFSAIAHLQKAPITAIWENLPVSRCSAHGRKYYYFCQMKYFKCSYSKLYNN